MFSSKYGVITIGVIMYIFKEVLVETKLNVKKHINKLDKSSAGYASIENLPENPLNASMKNSEKNLPCSNRPMYPEENLAISSAYGGMLKKGRKKANIKTNDIVLSCLSRIVIISSPLKYI